MTVARFVMILLALVAAASLALGSPLCCIVGDSCCSITDDAQVEAPCCSQRGTDEPEKSPEPAPRCECGDHAPDLTLDHAAVTLAPLMVSPACVLDATQSPETLILAVRTTVPPSAPSALSLPLLL